MSAPVTTYDACDSNTASLLGFILPSVFKEHKDDLNAVFSNKAKTTDESHATILWFSIAAQRMLAYMSRELPITAELALLQGTSIIPYRTGRNH